MDNENESGGYVMVMIVATMIPLLTAVGAFTMLMNNRTSELRVHRDDELALLAAESGVDYAIYKGRTGSLVHGDTYCSNLGSGLSFCIEFTNLEVDGLDNDGDGDVDSADDDENVFQVVVKGTYRNTSRRVAAYLGPVPLMPSPDSAFITQDSGIGVNLAGTPSISGHDTRLDGSAGPGPSVHGLSISSPGTVAHLLSQLTPAEQARVQGLGGAPSLGLSTVTYDIPTIVAQLSNMANVVLTSRRYAAYNFGDGSAGIANITLRNGDVDFSGNSQGAGVLVVTGDLNVKGTFRFDGIVIVLGEFSNSAGTADIYGAILQGPSGTLIDGRGTLSIQYSSEAINLANSLSGRYVSLNGWQELSRD